MSIRETKQRWFMGIWIACALAAGWFYYNWHVAKDYVGIVESVMHSIGPQESGVIRDMLVSIRDEVKKDQVLAVLDTSDIDRELEHLNTELKEALSLEESNRKRFALELQRLRLQLDNESSDLTNQSASIESKQAELAGLNAEIEKLQDAEAAGLGHSRDLTELVLKRDALSGYLKQQQLNTDLTRKRSRSAETSQNAMDTTDEEHIINSMLAEASERVSDTRKEILAAESRKKMRHIISPCDGSIVDIFAHAGDTIKEYVPVLSVMERTSGFLNVFVPEKSDFPVKEGLNVSVYPVRSDIGNTKGKISFIHPGYSKVPDRLTIRGQALWARIVRVTLDSSHNLLPGEIVHVRIDSGNSIHGFSGSRAAADDKEFEEEVSTGPTRPQTIPIRVPESISRVSRFEPSGIAWLEEAGKFIVVSDDTGIAETPSEHAPCVFLMDETGILNLDPIPVQGVTSFNDIEAITAMNPSTFILVSSNNISRKDNRHSDRREIHKMEYKDGSFRVVSTVDLMSLLLRYCSPDRLKELGMTQRDADSLPVLNIEGATFRNGDLYLGLKEPTINAKAMIWRITDIESVFASGTLSGNQISLFGVVGIGSDQTPPGGISDLMFDRNGKLYILSTIPNVEDNDQIGGFHAIERFADGTLRVKTIFTFPGQKPEGLCFFKGDDMMIVFDADQSVPSILKGKTDLI